MLGRICRPSAVFLTLVLASVAVTRAAEEQIEALPVLESSIGGLELEGQRYPLAYTITTAGPLVALGPVAGRLGGELEIGPLQQAHALTIGETEFLFGPGGSAIVSADEIRELTQAPIVSADGLRVSIDLLESLYSNTLGWAFDWHPDRRSLEVTRRPLREVPLNVDLVHLQGVTTVVLQFSGRPRYRVQRVRDGIRVSMLGDRLSWQTRRFPTDALVRDVAVQSEAVVIRLAAGAEAQEYTLSNPFRLVFDVYRGATPRPVGPRLQRPRRTPSGVETIVIDPGHGGSDLGAVGPAGEIEKNLTLQLARLLQARLQARLPVRVVLTRDEDADLPLETRAAIANQLQADLFVSLHLNSAFETGAQGAETFFLSLEASDERALRAAQDANRGSERANLSDDLQLILWDMAQSRYLARSQRLASLIQEELNQALGLRDRGVKQAPFVVLMGAAMPAVLVELGFLSNDAEERRLADPAHQIELADSLVRALTRFRASSGDDGGDTEARP